MVPFKFRTKICAHAAQIFSHLAHGARILRSRVIILVSSGFQPKATSKTTRWIELYNMQWKSKGLHLVTHMIKLVQSTMVPLKFRTKDCNMHWKVSNDQYAWKSLKEVTELKWTKRITSSTVLNLETCRWPAQRRNCTRMPLGPSKMDQTKFRRVPQFLFLIIMMVQTKYSLQSSEFLLTKDREIADNVHQGPLSVDFDDEWICA
jgi:hypothetical protein